MPAEVTPAGEDREGVGTHDAPINIRPDLTTVGIEEVERGICEDNPQNRAILRRAKLWFTPAYDMYGQVTGHLQVISPEMKQAAAEQSLDRKKAILADPRNRNSDYITGYDLLAEEQADDICPGWVIQLTKTYLAIQEGRRKTKPTDNEQIAPPHRCKWIKNDGIRCLNWASGQRTSAGMCRIHVVKSSKETVNDVALARKRLLQSAPAAVDTLEELMLNAISEPVRLKASTEILDRAGIRGGVEIDAQIEVVRPAAEVVLERLQKLAAGAAALEKMQEPAEITDAEVVSDDAE